MLTVPDLPVFDEVAQSRTLAALKGIKRAQPRLLWRSVAVFLDSLHEGVLSTSTERKPVLVLVHGEDGIEAQQLVLRRVEEYPGHFAPERDGYGRLLFPELGLKTLHERLARAMLEANLELAEGRSEASRTPIGMLMGEVSAGDVEILRRNNGTWMEVEAPDLPSRLMPPLDRPSLEGLNAEKVLIASPLSPPLRAQLVEELRGIFPSIEVLPWESIARGALRAGRLIERGLPHYLDRLTPISLAVMDGEGPSFHSLMPTTATVPANREYVSEPITGLRWGRGKTQIEFFVLKGHVQTDDVEVRHWTVNADTSPSQDAGVELRLRQTPGQSWAKLSLTSKNWDGLQAIELEWDRLRPDPRSPEEILAALERPNPTVPRRIIEEPHLLAWIDDGGVVGLATRLESHAPVKDLAQAIRRSKWVADLGLGFRPIGTDGTFPANLLPHTQRLFSERLEEAERQIVEVWRGNGVFRDNSALLFATWAFARCPVQIQEALVETLEREAETGRAPLLATNGARVVIIAGAGRAVTGTERLGRMFHTLVNRQTNTVILSALSSALSRRAEAPGALTPALVAKIASRLDSVLDDLVAQRSFKIKFKNALTVLTGLLRYREIEPWALVRDRNLSAEKLALRLESAKEILSSHAGTVPQGAMKIAIVSDLIDYLSGVGGDPNILRQIEDLGDTEE
ncbi:hypothetical protein [Devosia sp. YR412]|uniref:hypothetical protein n=1 Tax=Devosia sp. YR412 TaxID=1881030 RepID=UPI000B88AD0B|nr:hypothetical protein [Devosia sp. YR412]